MIMRLIKMHVNLSAGEIRCRGEKNTLTVLSGCNASRAVSEFSSRKRA